jgi:putative SOS response-associated peptidase YedK
MAVLRRADRMQWLDHRDDERDLLRPHPPGTFKVRRFERQPQSELLLLVRSSQADDGRLRQGRFVVQICGDPP